MGFSTGQYLTALRHPSARVLKLRFHYYAVQRGQQIRPRQAENRVCYSQVGRGGVRPGHWQGARGSAGVGGGAEGKRDDVDASLPCFWKARMRQGRQAEHVEFYKSFAASKKAII